MCGRVSVTSRHMCSNATYFSFPWSNDLWCFRLCQRSMTAERGASKNPSSDAVTEQRATTDQSWRINQEQQGFSIGSALAACVRLRSTQPMATRPGLNLGSLGNCQGRSRSVPFWRHLSAKVDRRSDKSCSAKEQDDLCSVAASFGGPDAVPHLGKLYHLPNLWGSCELSMRLAIQNGHSLSGLGSSGGKEMERMCEEKHGTRVRARRFHGTFWTPLASTAGFSNMRWWNHGPMDLSAQRPQRFLLVLDASWRQVALWGSGALQFPGSSQRCAQRSREAPLWEAVGFQRCSDGTKAVCGRSSSYAQGRWRTHRPMTEFRQFWLT